MNEKSFNIGLLAKLSGITLRTIRWYTELGLLQVEGKNQKGHAVYGEKSLEKFYKNSGGW